MEIRAKTRCFKQPNRKVSELDMISPRDIIVSKARGVDILSRRIDRLLHDTHLGDFFAVLFMAAKSNLTRSISPLYSMVVQVGRQLHLSRYCRA